MLSFRQPPCPHNAATVDAPAPGLLPQALANSLLLLPANITCCNRGLCARWSNGWQGSTGGIWYVSRGLYRLAVVRRRIVAGSVDVLDDRRNLCNYCDNLGWTSPAFRLGRTFHYSLLLVSHAPCCVILSTCRSFGHLAVIRASEDVRFANCAHANSPR